MRRLTTLSGHLARKARRALTLPAAIALCLAMLAAATTARAELRVDITRGHVEPLPIAIDSRTDVTGADAETWRNITDVITRNLERSGLFEPINSAAFIAEPVGMSVRPRFPDWRIINAQALVTGRVAPSEADSLMVEFRLWDVFAEQSLVGLKLRGAREAWRSIAHTMSDKIYERLTGESGYFHTRIVYIAETGPPDQRIKRLAIMDQDGQNLRYLSDGRHLVLTPRFSPKEQEITYLSYEGGVPRVYLRQIDTGQQEMLGDFPGMTFAPRFSPDGNQVVMTIAERGNSDIYEMDLRSRQVRRLTDNPAIETAPCYSPDGAFIAFESDRGGSQQIYVMRRDGGDVRRITFGQGRYGTPVWSPRGDLIAFTKSHRGQFYIGVMRPDGSGERILAQDYLVEGPTWAPNGRVLMFFRSSSRDPDSAELVTIDLTGRNDRTLFTSTAASDPAWSPLIQ